MIMTRREARRWAERYVSAMISRGYTARDAAREGFAAMGAPGEPGYIIRSGKISVPGSLIHETHQFDFAALAAPRQLELF
jgi:hypothetical protein